MAWTDPSTRSTGYKVTAANWNELVNNMLYLAEVAYVEFVANVSVTVTTVGTAVQVVSAGAITFTADPIMIEFFCPHITQGTGLNLILRDGTTVLGTLLWQTGAADQPGVHVYRRFTPTAASHTYNIAAWNASAGTNTVNAGTGGAAGDGSTPLPGFIRITRIPT